MLTGEIRNQVDKVWDAFWTGGISNPLEVIEQLTYLLFIKGLDESNTAVEGRINTMRQLGMPTKTDDLIYPESGSYQPDERSSETFPYQQLRWSMFRDFEPRQMYDVITRGVFPFIKAEISAENTPFTRHMQNARLSLPVEKAGLVARVVGMLDDIDMADRDTKGDLYEYLLSKLSTAGQNGQFRTPRHIIQLMVQLLAPTPNEVVCDPASGTAGFLVAASEYVRDTHPQVLTDPTLREHFNGPMFQAFDFDTTMLRIATMNLMLHGITHPDVRNQDSLSTTAEDQRNVCDVLLANPPFKGSLDVTTVANDLKRTVKTKKTELLFLALFLRLLKPGGRAAVIVPDGVLFGSSRAHKQVRQLLVNDHKLDGVVSMPSGVFKPYAGVSTAILLFTRTDSGGTDDVWFYDMQADGYSLDDKRTALGQTTDDGRWTTTHEQSNLPDILARWGDLAAEKERPRTAQSFMVPRSEIVANDFDLSINRYKEIVYEAVEYDPPHVILDQLEQMEADIQRGMAELREMLG